MEVEVERDVEAEVELSKPEELDVPEVLPPTFEEPEGMEVLSVAEAEAELLSVAGEELDAAEMLPPTLDELEGVEVLDATKGGIGASVVFFSAEGDTTGEVGTGKAGLLSMVKFRKSLPNLLIIILKILKRK